jgi:transcription elongation factor Elf1
MGLFKRRKSNEPIQVKIDGKLFQCTVCNNDRFWKDTSQLNKWYTSFLGLVWSDRSAVNLTCVKCGYMHWFRPDLIIHKEEDELLRKKYTE